MRLKEIKSLIWLCRWHNGRAQRLEELHHTHLATLTSLALDELGGVPTQDVELTLCGFVIRIAPSPLGLALLSITPPELFDGEQLVLFSDEALAEVLMQSQSNMEVQHEAAA